jgi:hypothetical protein
VGKQKPYVIVAAENGVLNAIDLMVDAAGADYLINCLQRIKAKAGHIHINANLTSPFGHQKVYPEIILDWLETD